jgi:hypothetical protein
LDLYLTTNKKKKNSKCIEDLNVTPVTIKPLEEKIRVKLCYISVGNDCLDMTPKVHATKSKTDK